ncbi:tyrosine-type recombinase/integrase [Paenibacillus sp. GCM10027626]|uniref:tyrosine-type recombinase/integrase n=1 Tax=Paenibacillus sp. GCM10027626 TaxID=3273411 RepID=UPI0036384399
MLFIYHICLLHFLSFWVYYGHASFCLFSGNTHIGFHDLRHRCATLLLSNGVSMKKVQEWLAQSDYSTTANIYSHLENSSKVSSANTMHEVIKEIKKLIRNNF